MAEELKSTKEASANTNDPSYVCPLEHGMSPEEAAQLKAAQEEAEEQRNEAMFAKKEVEDLKRELWEARREKQRLESIGSEDVVVLEGQVEELKGISEDLNMEIKRLNDVVEQKEDELVLPSFLTWVNYRMCCRINWPKRRTRWRSWKLETSVLQMMTSSVNNSRQVKARSRFSTR